jgi:hypothetical protein
LIAMGGMWIQKHTAYFLCKEETDEEHLISLSFP